MSTDAWQLAEDVAAFYTGVVGSVDIIAEHRDLLTIDLGTFEKRRIAVMEQAFASLEPADRAEDTYDVRLVVVIAERYINPPDADFVVPMAWTKIRKEFVEEVFSLLTNTRTVYYSNGSAWRAQFGEVTAIYDYSYLDKNKVFWSEFEVTFRKEARSPGLDPDTLPVTLIVTGPTVTRVTFNRAVSILGVPVWTMTGGRAVLSTVVVSPNVVDVTWSAGVSPGETITIGAEDPSIRTLLLDGHVTTGGYLTS